MICRSCGQEISDEAKFCPYCGMDPAGTAGGGSAWSPSPGTAGYAGPEAPVGRRKGKGLLIGGIVAAVAVVTAAAVAVSGLFSNPKGQVERALAKSTAAYAQASDRMGLPDLSGLSREQSYSQGFTLSLNEVSSNIGGVDLSDLRGLGLRMAAGLSGRERKLDFELSAFWDDQELLRLLLLAEDAELYFNSPQVTGDIFYGVNTETIGADLARTTGDDSMKNMSFNLFDWVDMVVERTDPEAMEQALKEANGALWEAVQVKKEGTRTRTVNGTEQKTASYQVTVPREAMADYVDALAEVMSSVNYYDLYEEMFRSMGMPEEELEDFLEELEEMDIYGEAADQLKEALKELGDLELEVCLYDGYVSALLYEGDIDGSDVELTLNLGGGGEYVDDIRLDMEIEGQKLTLVSSGDHGGKSGVFTDETTIRLTSGSLNMGRLTSDFRYDPKGTGSNLSWELTIPGAGSLDMTGRLTAGEDSVSLALDDISVKVMGLEVCSLGLEYWAGPYEQGPSLTGEPQIITRMDENQLMQMVLDTQERVLNWSSEMEALFISRLPAELIYGMMYE